MFVKGVAFDWYTKILVGKLDSWDQLEQESLRRFYSTRWVVRLPELACTKQKKEELVLDYIEKQRNLVLGCKEKISEAFFIDIGVHQMQWEFYIVFKGICRSLLNNSL